MTSVMTSPLHRFSIDAQGIHHNGDTHPVAGAHAEITTSGMLLTRRTFLTVTGPGWSYAVRLGGTVIARARRFAAEVNAASQLLAAQEHGWTSGTSGRG